MDNGLKTLPTIQSMGDQLFDLSWREFHQGNVSEILHIVDGQCDLIFEDGRTFHAASGETLFIPANTPHKDCFDADAFPCIFHIVFTWEPAEQILNCLNRKILQQFSSDCLREMRLIFDSMRVDHGVGTSDKILAESRLMTILLLVKRELERITSGKAPSSKNDHIEKHKRLVVDAKKYIEDHFSELIILDDIAQHLQVSPYHLSRMFSKESNFSLFEYLTEVRIKEAQKLLRGKRHFVSEVAQMVGFEDNSYFSKVFKRVAGCSPSKYQ